MGIETSAVLSAARDGQLVVSMVRVVQQLPQRHLVRAHPPVQRRGLPLVDDEQLGPWRS